jgi:hypothetical protein
MSTLVGHWRARGSLDAYYDRGAVRAGGRFRMKIGRLSSPDASHIAVPSCEFPMAMIFIVIALGPKMK